MWLTYELKYINISFGGHFGRHLGNLHLHFYPIATTMDQFPDLETIETDSSIVFVADLLAEVYKYLFWWPYWPPSWKFTV